MYTTASERLTGALGAMLVVGLLAGILLFGLSAGLGAPARPAISSFALQPPQRAEPLPKPKAAHPMRAKSAGRPSKPALRARATPLVAPVPQVRPIAPVLAALPHPTLAGGPSIAPGAADVPGNREGTGGLGNGNGGVGTGDGVGDGDDGDTPPRQIKGHLSNSDLPQQMRDDRVQGTVSVRYEVRPDGRVGTCEIAQSSGTPELDDLTCALIQQRFRFRPSRDRDGHPVAATIEEDHHWHVEEPPPER